jgi:hypothetical protein
MDKMHASMNFSSLKTGHITDTFFIFINNKTQIIQNQCAKVQLFFVNSDMLLRNVVVISIFYFQLLSEAILFFLQTML